MKNLSIRITLIRAKWSMLFWDCLAWISRVDSWENLRDESKEVYKALKLAYERDIRAAKALERIEKIVFKNFNQRS